MHGCIGTVSGDNKSLIGFPNPRASLAQLDREDGQLICMLITGSYSDVYNRG